MICAYIKHTDFVTFTPNLHNLLSCFLVASLLFGFLGAGIDSAFERGYPWDIQGIIALDYDELPGSGDLEPFLPQALISLACTTQPVACHVTAPVRPVLAIYSPPPRPPAFA